MEKHFFRYQILRYIADVQRMETQNVGIIIQNPRGASCRFQTRMGSRPGFDHENYRHWREFFEAEINGPPVPIFQPNRTEIEFLQYLQERCYGNYSLTRPLELVLGTASMEVAEDHLFKTLVLAPDDKDRGVSQPVQKLRAELKERKILNNPAFKHKALFKSQNLTELVEYHYLRNHGADMPVIIQPVQILADISRTINALERAEALAVAIEKANVHAAVSVVVDEVPAPENNDSDTKKWAYDRIQEGKEELRQRGVEIIDSTAKTVRLAESIEKDLYEIEAQPPMTYA